jgi:TetR/AcrR family transcriptional regulator, cholesterol catabolism regulator
MPRGGQSSKGAILRLFADMIADHGYDEVSLSMVASELGISKGTIVHHYGTKDRMLEAVHHEYMTRRLAEAHAFLEQFEEPEQQLTAFVVQLLLCHRDDRAATVVFGREVARFATEELMRDVRHMRAEYTALVVDVIKRGMADGVFREDDADLVALQIFGSTNWSWTWISHSRWSFQDIAATWMRTLLGGLRRSGDATVDDLDIVFTAVEGLIAQTAAGDTASAVS